MADTDRASAAPTAAAASGEGPCDVFISYSTRDAEPARRLEAMLIEHGKSVFRYAAGSDGHPAAIGLKANEEMNEALPRRLREAACIVVIWSAHSVASQPVQLEVGYAWGEGKLVGVHVAGFDFSSIKSSLGTYYVEPIEPALERPANLLAAIAAASDPARRKPGRRVDISRLPTTYAKRLFGRDTEMADLHAAWDSAADPATKTNVVVLDAMGGTGKTALVNHFVQQLEREDWRGAERVFVWSFYSQGTDDKRQASADEFFKAALAFFGHTGDAPVSPHDKGVRLAELVALRRALVILDGLEPLQYGPSRRAGGSGDAGLTGGLKDQGLRALFRQLAHTNPGLLLVTTRLKVPDLNGFDKPRVVTERLGQIPTHDGVELIRTIGVAGAHAEMKDLVEDLRGHAIALTQVATWLVRFKGGDVRSRDELPSLVDLGGDNERDPFRVMKAYELQFTREIDERLAKGDKPADIAAAKQLGLLFLMGLFDRPMERGDREALLRAPAIPGLTDGLIGLSPGQIDYGVAGLRDLGLLLPKDDASPGDLDAHPLVREYFGARLEKERPEAWKAAHGRLYDYYRFRGLPEAFRTSEAYGLLAYKVSYPDAALDRRIAQALKGELTVENAPNVPQSIRLADPDRLRTASKLIDGPEWKVAMAAFLPENEEAMAPLFTAIAHGAAAGYYDEAFNEVYWPRITRGNEQYAVHKLGLHGSNLAAIAHFFAEPFAAPAAGLTPGDRSIVLNVAGYALRALGRLGEAVEPMQAALMGSADTKNWKGAATDASNLSELLVTLGWLQENPTTGRAGAVTTGRDAVAYADRSGDAGNRMGHRTTHADALLQAGRWHEAATIFAEAEVMQRERQPDLPLLYSLQGYRSCDLKLAQGRAAEVRARATQTLKWGGRQYALLDRALDTLSLGRAAHLAALDAGPTPRPPRGVGRGVGQPLAPGLDPDLPSDTLSARGERGSAAALLDDAVEGLRTAGGLDDLPRGLLARAAWHRDFPDAVIGSDRLATRDLAEAFEIAERGGMRLFLADCWLESAWQRIVRPQPSAESLDRVAKAIERAAAIVAETGYHRRDPDLALARAALHLVTAEQVDARRHIDALVAAMRANDLWGFLPRLDRLAARYDLAELGPTLEALRAERAHFDTAADVAFAEARKIRRSDGLDDDVIDARLADPAFRKRLDAVLVANGYKPSVETPLEEQRNDARAYILKIERKQEAAPEPDAGDAATFPDELVTQMLSTPGFRDLLQKALADAGHVFAELSPDDQREAARHLMAAIMKAKTDEPAGDATPPPPEAAVPPPPAPARPPPEPEKPKGLLERWFGPFIRR